MITALETIDCLLCIFALFSFCFNFTANKESCDIANIVEQHGDHRAIFVVFGFTTPKLILLQNRKPNSKWDHYRASGRFNALKAAPGGGGNGGSE